MNLHIDILNKDCKLTNHSCCLGYWEGLGLEVYCNCSCHENNIILSSANVNNNSSTDKAYQKNNDNRINIHYTVSGNLISNKNDDISERETANLHFSLTSSSSQKRSLQHNIKSNGDPTLA